MKVKVRGVRRIGINGPYIRLDALLKYASIAQTGGEAKLLIQDGRIAVGGEVCIVRGRKIRPGDIVRCGNDVFIVQTKIDRACEGRR